MRFSRFESLLDRAKSLGRAQVPIVLKSRNDIPMSKFMALAMAALSRWS